MKFDLFGFSVNIGKRSSLENPQTTLREGADWLLSALGGQESAAGVRVNEQSAMRSSAVWGCIRVLSSGVAGLPLMIYRRTDKGREVARDHHLYRLLHDQPNSNMTSYTWRQVQQAHVTITGNAYAYIHRTGNSRKPSEIRPILPEKVRPERKAGQLVYQVQVDDKGRYEEIDAWRMIHVPGMGFDGIVGYSPIRVAADNIGLALAAQEFGAKFFGSGANLSGVVEHPAKLSDDALAHLKKSFDQNYSGLSNAHKTLILEEGMKWNRTQVPPEEAQFLETRKFQTEDIARLYGVPLHMLGSTEKSTSWGSGLEQQNLGYLQHTLRPWLVAWEQELNRKLLLPSERDEYTIEFNLDGLLRGDTGSRYEAYAIGRQWGWLSINDIRDLENMNRIDGGDTYLVPLNMQAHDEASGDADQLRMYIANNLLKRERNGLSKQLAKDSGDFAAWWGKFSELTRSQLVDGLGLSEAQAKRFADSGGKQIESAGFTLPDRWEAIRSAELMELINEN